jgi:hypothetical protein
MRLRQTLTGSSAASTSKSHPLEGAKDDVIGVGRSLAGNEILPLDGARLVRNAGSRAAQSRKTSSRLAPQQQPIDFGDVMLTRGYSGTRAYCQSKLAQIMFTVDLGAALEGTGVTVTCLHPATYMDTSMVRRAGVRPLSTVEEGARAILNLATSPAVEGQTGLYFNGLHQAKAQAQAYDRDARRQLQALSLELTGLSAQGVAAPER